MRAAVVMWVVLALVSLVLLVGNILLEEWVQAAVNLACAALFTAFAGGARRRSRW